MKIKLKLLLVLLPLLMFNQVNAEDVYITLGPSSSNGFHAIVGLGNNATDSAPEHEGTVFLEPESPYRFINPTSGVDVYVIGGNAKIDSSTIVGDGVEVVIEKISASSELTVYGEMARPGTGPGGPEDFDVKTATVDLEIKDDNDVVIKEEDEVGGPAQFTMDVGQGPVECFVNTTNLPASGEDIIIFGEPFLYSRTESESPQTSITLPNAGGSFYVWPGLSVESGTVEAICFTADSGIATDIVAATVSNPGGRYLAAVHYDDNIVDDEFEQGDLVHYNYGKRLKFTPMGYPPSSYDFVWTPSAGGTIAIDPNNPTGPSVAWDQEDDFVSSVPNDIKVTCTDLDTENSTSFVLTSFRIFSQSGVLFTGETRVFPSDVKPENLDALISYRSNCVQNAQDI